MPRENEESRSEPRVRVIEAAVGRCGLLLRLSVEEGRDRDEAREDEDPGELAADRRDPGAGAEPIEEPAIDERPGEHADDREGAEGRRSHREERAQLTVELVVQVGEDRVGVEDEAAAEERDEEERRAAALPRRARGVQPP